MQTVRSRILAIALLIALLVSAVVPPAGGASENGTADFSLYLPLVLVDYYAPPPTVDLKVNDSDGPVNLTSLDMYSISWSSTSANSCTGSGALAGYSGTSGSFSDGPKAAGSYTYTITCSNVNGSASDSVTVNIEASREVASLSAGYYHTCALMKTGGVKCWGVNWYGQLGDGTITRRLTPVDVSGLGSGVSAISVGYLHTCAVMQTGGVKCWGNNNGGQLGDGTWIDRITPVDVSGLGGAVSAISLGFSHTCALLQTGGVKCWGDNSHYQLGDGTNTDRNTPAYVHGLEGGVSAISSGLDHSCALMQTGGVKCWGDNYFGQLGDGSTTTRLTPVDAVKLASGVGAISASAGAHACALMLTGEARCWGDNFNGQLGDGTTTNRHTPTKVKGLSSGVSALLAGGWHTCALWQTGAVKCWGANGNGQLGDGTTTERHTPVGPSGLRSGVSAIYPGYYHTCALMQAGGVKCWGKNEYGQLGDGTTTDRHTPVDVVGLQ